MRTTLTVDDEVARRLHEAVRRTGSSFKQVVNDALRAGLDATNLPGEKLPRFEVVPSACGFRSGIDLLRLNQLNDELELASALSVAPDV